VRRCRAGGLAFPPTLLQLKIQRLCDRCVLSEHRDINRDVEIGMCMDKRKREMEREQRGERRETGWTFFEFYRASIFDNLASRLCFPLDCGKVLFVPFLFLYTNRYKLDRTSKIRLFLSSLSPLPTLSLLSLLFLFLSLSLSLFSLLPFPATKFVEEGLNISVDTTFTLIIRMATRLSFLPSSFCFSF